MLFLALILDFLLLVTPGAWAASPAAHRGITVQGDGTSTATARPKAGANARFVGAFGRLPLRFEANQGETDPQVKYLARGRGYTLFLTANQAVLAMRSGRSSMVSGQLQLTTDYGPPTPGKFTLIPNLGPLLALPELPTPTVLRMKLLGANAKPKVTGLDELPGRSHYFIGKDPENWRTNIRTYAKVRYQGVYPGVDLVYYGNQSQLEYDFIVAPGADPRVITLQIETGDSNIENRNSKLETNGPLVVGGQLSVVRNTERSGVRTHDRELAAHQSKIENPKSEISVDAHGDLVIETAAGQVRFHKPLVYQPEEGRQLLQAAGKGLGTTDNPKSQVPNHKFLDVRYVLRTSDPKPPIQNAKCEVGFEVAAYDPSRPLVIDPVLSYSTYLGGSSAETGYAVAVDKEGNAYVTGSTGSTDFPTAGAAQSTSGGDFDIFVSKLNAAGTALVYSTYLGGNGFDRGTGIVVDGSGNAYLTGMTASTNFPTTSGALQTTLGGGTCGTTLCSDAFVTKLNPAGSQLVYSTYLGGGNADFGQGIVVDGSGSAYVTGTTQSTNFPTAAPLQAASGGNADAFVAKLKPDGTGVVYSTYFGGADGDFGQAIALDSAGNAYVTGYTFSTNFPTVSPLQSANAGSADAFVAKLNPAGSALVYSTYLGGGGLDRAFSLAVDGSGNAYLAGDTASPDFPVSSGAFQTAMGGSTCGAGPCSDAFVAKLSSAGSSLAYSTYLGGVDVDQASGVAVDASGQAFVTGFTRSDDFPVVSPLQATFGGGACGSNACADAFVVELDAAGAGVVYSTYLGGEGSDFGQAIAVDGSDNVYVTGGTASPNFPVTVGALQVARGGNVPTGDAFLVKIAPPDAPAVALFPQKLDFADQATGFTSRPQTVTLTNSGSAPLSVINIAASGDFAQTNTCGTSVPAGGATCTLSVTFTPMTTGSLSGDVTITDDAAGSPHVIALTGKGVPPAPAVTLTPSSLTFPDQTFDTTSSPLSVTLTNSGTAELTITKIDVTGDFAQTNTCPLSPDTLGVGAECVFSVTFTPKASGSLTGSITITDNGSNATSGKHTVALSGTGLAVFTLSATETSAIVTRGNDSTTFKLTAAAPSDFSASITLACTSSGSATCAFNPTSIKAGATSTLTVNGLKQVSQSSLDFKVTGTSGSQNTTLALSIDFADFSLSVAPTFAAVTAGDSTSLTLTLTPTNGFTGTASFSCSRLPQETTCTFSPGSVSLEGSNPSTAQVTIRTTTRTVTAPPGPPWSLLPWLVGLMLLAITAKSGLTTRRRAPRFATLTAAILLFVLFLASCGNEFFQFRGTPSGVFAIALNAKVGEVSHSALVSLTVN